MVAYTDVMEAEKSGKLSLAGHATSRALSHFMGIVMSVSAFGLWIVPGSSYDPQLMLLKMGVTLFLMIGGAMFLVAARKAHHPEVQLDPSRGILKLRHRDERGTVIGEDDISYDDLSEVDFRDGMLIARDHFGEIVVEMPVEAVGDLDQVRAALGPAFSRSA
ncbi:hypothetical protein [Rhodalgimonas zhirmunskyi]|uniref:Uncharacterized protein n=1 Tax=Rhodalgimonas zhirmunskyi TaxID=2964767 RepID=A0AAJ1UCB0_9RHOB|nr:hypothetical protein [Rhodoalgimonas zhirmunskyi]MDQ2095263.1 hypothetical protein [Rhodoalgimonas zhirmunskyi]